jgi:branched-chain amino acid transport system ATP-binding protein
MLQTTDLTIRFGGHVAVDHVSCAFQPGTLTAIVGPNGAGKTTFFNLISGQLRASAGSVRLDGIDITRESAAARTHRGLGRAFQLTQLFPGLTVLENVRLAVQSRRKQGLNLWSIWSDQRATLDRAMELVTRVKLADRAAAVASSLPHGDQRKLEVAMLMALEPSVYMFDEPTAGMSVDDVPVILDLIRALKREADKTILLVEHKMDVVRENLLLAARHARTVEQMDTVRLELLVEHKMDVVRELADRIVVLHNGQLVADGEPAEVIASDVVQSAYLGIVPEEIA